MTQDTAQQPKKHVSTQKLLPIQEIKEDCIILKNGSMRAILMVSSINLALKSPDEQKAIIMSYRDFLNTLHDWHIQILIQSRKVDIDSYLNTLIEKAKVQENELLRGQMRDYIEYISELVELGQITTKRFYIVIPHSMSEDASKGFFEKISATFSSPAEIVTGRKVFQKQKELLTKRIDYVRSGLAQMNLSSVLLNTQSLVELFYGTYNPLVSVSEKMPKLDKIKIDNN